MTKAELVKLCADFPDAQEDYPFEGDATPVLRHRGNRKWYAMVLVLGGRLCVNLKCEPLKAQFWRDTYRGVAPAWHMNKTHWNTVYLDADVPLCDLQEMVADSYALTATHARARRHRQPPAQ